MLNQKILESKDDKSNNYPAKYQSVLELKNGKKLLVRPVKPTDERMVQALHYSLDKQDRFYRFFSYMQDFGHNTIKPLVNINYNTDMVLIAEYTENGEDQIIALGGFFKKMNPRVGELIFVTHKNWRGLGITRYLLKFLIKIARDLQFMKLGGLICLGNKPMFHIMNSGEYKLTIKEIQNDLVAVIMEIVD